MRPADTAPAVGSAKEETARRYLEAQGLWLETRNYRCRQGEIDLIMRDGDCLVFVEVRYRRNARFGGAVESITGTKQRRIIAAAQHYLQRHPTRLDCRFDVLAMTGGDDVQWLKNAFQQF